MATDPARMGPMFTAPTTALIAATERLRELVVKLAEADGLHDHAAVIRLTQEGIRWADRLPGLFNQVAWTPYAARPLDDAPETETEARAAYGDR